jgi:hypothetical protein
MQVGTRADNKYTQLQSAILIMALNQGWMTAVVDDGGLWGVFGWSLIQKCLQIAPNILDSFWTRRCL